MNKYICIHGHFYQPPRENPWLGIILDQESAYPYANWNEKISQECYGVNTESPVLSDQDGRTQLVNNYSYMSFNFGPTLLSWIEDFQPEVYKKIIDADKVSKEHFKGHGSAMAQAYNHMIMPLANERDKETQVLWGIKDFEHRFGRTPEGMWLPETAVDLKTLEALARNDIAFTILAPAQAKAIRKLNSDSWDVVTEKDLDTHRPYLCQLPSKQSIVIFFYNGNLSHQVAFGPILKDGIQFANQLMEGFDESSFAGQLVHIATDGESYGHHHAFGNMALSYCIQTIQKNKDFTLTNYSHFLEQFPPMYEVQIHEETSWSCSHGVERWKSDCGCNFSDKKRASQEWRSHLRDALDWLRDQASVAYEIKMTKFYKDPWELRNKYINLILSDSKQAKQKFLKLNQLPEKQIIFNLLEMQKYTMLMYTSCGWFFDDISGIETRQILQYAARVIEILKDLTPVDVEDEFLNRLEEAKSNLEKYKNGRHIYETYASGHAKQE